MGSPPEGERGSPVSGKTWDMGNTLRRCLAYTDASAPPGRVDRKRRKDDLAGAPLLPREKRRDKGKNRGRGRVIQIGKRGDRVEKGDGS